MAEIPPKVPPHRVACEPAFMTSWAQVVTEVQKKNDNEPTHQSLSTVQDNEKPLIDFESGIVAPQPSVSNAESLLANSESGVETTSESNKTIELLKKYGLYHFYANDHIKLDQ